MDPDILMSMLSNITQEISEVKSEARSIWSYASDITETNNKLDRIIELLEKLIDE